MKPNPTVLVIDDDPRILRFLQLNLEADGYTVLGASTGRAGLEALLTHRPDAIILDLILPDIDGLELCERIREFSDIPIIVLTARKREEDMVQGLDLGADDYIVKPFSQATLLARLRAVLRRASFSQSATHSPDLICGEVVLHSRDRRLTVGHKSVKLSHTEFKLLHTLMANANHLIATDDLVTRVWGPEFVGETESLRTYIRYLRQKIEEDPKSPKCIVTERGIGYIFIDPLAEKPR
ncbi:MAG TPA: response regulator transcription factor [Anaerolineae bacterium]